MLIENHFIPTSTTEMLSRYLKNTSLKAHQIISLPGAPTCQSGPEHVMTIMTNSITVYVVILWNIFSLLESITVLTGALAVTGRDDEQHV
jgi:hypothetical protein